MNLFLVRNAPMTAPMNARGCGRMLLNVRVLQQNLKNVEDGPGAELGWAMRYFELFAAGPDGVLKAAKEDAEGKVKEGESREKGYSYDEYKALLELWYSEGLYDKERGVAAAAKRQLGEKVLGLSEVMWQT
jgi:exocyst complex component 4